MAATLQLKIDNQVLEFHHVILNFHSPDIGDIFANKNNKTLAETLATRKYHHLLKLVQQRYPEFLNSKLGEFLYSLKLSGDTFYRAFLNTYGDDTYCSFSIADFLFKKGLYCYAVGGEVRYIGRCTDSFSKRINQGYGKIHPKNCYKDGQSTNCHLNSLINQYRDSVAFFVCCIDDIAEIKRLELMLIRQTNPQWNTQLKSK